MRELGRREFLGMCASAGLLGCARLPGALGFPGPPALAGDALDQAARVRRGETSPRELVLETIARIEALDGPLNAVTTRFFERALRRADGPLPDGPFRGVPFLLKDLNDLAGTRKTMGSRLFADFVSPQSSPHTQRTLDAGMIVLGKTNTPEFGLVATTESALLGLCRNPWDPTRSSGGSSGGAAVAVAAGMLPMAQGSDGGGSIRIPASCCGVFGLKPSRGRNPPEEPSEPVGLAVKHALSRSVRDSAAYLAVTEQRGATAPLEPVGFVKEPARRRLRIAFHTDNVYGRAADPEVAAAVESTAQLCEELGHRVEPATPDYQGEAFREHFLDLWASVPAAIEEQVRERGGDPTRVLEPVTLGMAALYRSRPEGAIQRAIAFFSSYSHRMNGFFEEYDALLTPVLRTPPIPLGTQAGTLPFDRVLEPLFDYVSYTPVWNATGNPAMSVPLGWSAAGLPIGSQLIARLGGEATLFSLAYELEAVAPWADRWPPRSV